MNRFTGTVLFFNEIIGRGYLLPDNSTETIRFDYRDIILEGYRALSEGQRVNFTIETRSRGPRAASIHPQETDSLYR
jgi:CspA family cold shock protein